MIGTYTCILIFLLVKLHLQHLPLAVVSAEHGDSTAFKAAGIEFSTEAQHPKTYLDILRSTGKSFIPFVKIVNASLPSSLKSKLSIYEQQSVPDTNAWSRCQQCVLHHTQEFLLFDHDDKVQDAVKRLRMSWSQWNEFFYLHGNDIYRAKYATSSEEKSASVYYVVDNPTYIIPLIAFHPGHFLIDLYEQIYNSMVETYGQVRTDAVIIIDVAAPHQRPYYHNYLHKSINNAGELDQIYSLLRSFTSLPIFTHNLLEEMLQSGAVLFTDIHIGANNQHSHYYFGYKFHPYSIPTTQHDIKMRYLSFQRHLLSYINLHRTASSNNSSSPWNNQISETGTSEAYERVLIVTKSSNRAIVNQEELVRFFEERPRSAVMVQDLAELTLQEQLSIFAEVDIFVAVAGTAIHNALFFKPSVLVVLIMQPLWCSYSWMYSNQLQILGLNYVVVCTESDDYEASAHRYEGGLEDINYLGVYRQSWKQGPRISKLHTIKVNISDLASKLNEQLEQNASSEVTRTLIDKSDDYNNQPEAMLQVVVSEIEFPDDNAASGSVNDGQIKVYYDLVGRRDDLTAILKSSPTLSICSIMPLTNEEEPICFQVEGMNYFSGMKLHVAQSEDAAVYMLQLWVQLSPDGGKIKDSDVFMPLDAGVKPGGGLKILDWIIGRTVRFSFLVVQYVDGGGYFQDVLADSMQYDLFRKYFSERNFATNHDLRHEEVYVDIQNRYTLQRYLPEFCRKKQIIDSNCASITQALYRNLHQWQHGERLKLPEVQHFPSPVNPFVFLHIDKTGGTTLRDFIANSTLKYNVSYFIPCYNNVSCMTFDLSQKDKESNNISAIAGHFFWDIWKTLPQAQVSDNNGSFLMNPEFKPSCFVMTRNPVQRIISLYNQRYFSEAKSQHYQKPINSFSPEEWETMLIYQRFARYKEDNETVIIVDEGMSDAACRSMLNIRTTTGRENPTSIDVPPELTIEETQQAIANVKQCVVGVLEQWDDTVRVINHWFPWISFENKFQMQLNQGRKGGDKYLSEELTEVTIRNNPCDIALHQAMLAQFELQKQVINLAVFDY